VLKSQIERQAKYRVSSIDI